MRFVRLLALALALPVAVAGGVAAQESSAPAAATTNDAASLGLALDALDPVEAGCRLSFVITNGMAAEIEDLSVEIAVFAADGGFDKMLRLNFGLLLDGKTRVRQFDVAGTPCEGIGSVLVNDIAACEAAALQPVDCLRAMRVTSRGDVPFGL